MNEYKHVTVLQDEAVDALRIKPDGFYIDATFGRGGHSRKILQQLNELGRLLVIDKDPQAIALAQSWAKQDQRVYYWHGSFQTLADAMAACGLNRLADGILLDLGVSSPQLDDASRGFSFMQDGLLDMRMNPNEGQSVAEWLNQADEKAIADVLWRYGEEKQSRRIARRIVEQREHTPFERTLQLANFIEAIMPRMRKPRHHAQSKTKHPATRSFQALRIFINRELSDLDDCLQQIPQCLAMQGRLVVISFHSLEDRIVKHYMREQANVPKLPRGLPIIEQQITPMLKLMGKAIKPSTTEIEQNARARSAIMRVAQRQA